MDGLILVLGALLALGALFLLWQGARQRRATGLPAGRVIASDTRAWGKVDKPLFDPVSGLTIRTSQRWPTWSPGRRSSGRSVSWTTPLGS